MLLQATHERQTICSLRKNRANGTSSIEMRDSHYFITMSRIGHGDLLEVVEFPPHPSHDLLDAPRSPETHFNIIFPAHSIR